MHEAIAMNTTNHITPENKRILNELISSLLNKGDATSNTKMNNAKRCQHLNIGKGSFKTRLNTQAITKNKILVFQIIFLWKHSNIAILINII